MNPTNRFSLLLLLFLSTHVSFAITGNSNSGISLEAPAPGVLTASITGTTNFCASPANGMITFEASGGNAPYTFTYQIDGNPVQTIATVGSSSTVAVPVNTLNDNIFTYRITGVKGATGNTASVNVAAIITVVKSPVVDFSFANNVCSDTPVQFTPTVQGTGNYTYRWDFGDGQTSTDQSPIHTFSSLGCGTIQTAVALTVTDDNGCPTTITRQITLLQKPDISFNDVVFPFGDPFNNCGVASAGNPDYSIIVGNTSASGACISSYSIDWGDGTAPVANAAFPASHTYTHLGTFNMVIKAMGANGCENSILYVVKNITNPSVGITSPGTTTNLCAPTASLKFEIANWGTNSPGTTYTVDYGDGSPIQIYTQEQLNASSYYVGANPSSSANFPIPHSYTISNCPNGAYMIRLIATNSCSSTEATVNNIIVLNKTTPDFAAASSACLNSNVVFTNTSLPGNNPSCNQSSIYTWDFGDGSPLVVTAPSLPTNANHTYTTPGNYTVTLTSKNICGDAVKTQQITINPLITGTVSGTGMVAGNISVCQNGVSPVITFTGANGTAPYTFTYRINNGPIQSIATTTGNSVTVTVPTGTPGSFTYTLLSIQESGTTGCTQPQTGTVTVVVKAPPTGTVSGPNTVCLNGALPVITFTGSNGTPPYTFTYNINGGAVQTISTTAGNSATITVPTNVLGDIKVNLLSMQDASTSACIQTLTGSATITVSSPPASMTLNDREFCVGENTSEIVFSNTVGGTTYSWTNSNTAIGLAASGTGNIPIFRAKNNTGSPITSIISVTPSVNGCDGAIQTFTITVYPPVTVLFTPGDQTICSGESTTLVTLGSTTAGALFSWSATQPSGITGVAASGTNIIPVQTLVNTTNGPITVIYRATATSAATASCPVFEYSYTITVNPLPVVGQTYNQSICGGGTFTVSPVNGALNSIPAGTRYTWSAPVISPAGSLTGGSAQNAPQSVISQTLVNNTAAGATATYTVTPVASGCPGAPFTVTVNVLPLPTATISGNATVCRNGASPLITFTGVNGTAPYSFTYRINGGAIRSVTTTSGNSATVSAPTGSAGTFIYTLVSVQEGSALACSKAQAGTATIIVSPLPTATVNASQNGCLNGSSPVITFTGNIGTPPYTFTYNINGGPTQTISTTSGSSVTLNVPTNVLSTYVYNLISVQDASANACQQPVTGAATVTISQPPAPMTLMDQEFCNGQTVPVINFTNTVSGTTYQWSSSNPSIGLAASGAGSLPSFTATNTTANPLTSTVTVTPSSNGCSGNSQTFTITVYPSAVVFVPGDQTLCSGENTSQVTLSSNITGAVFSWLAAQPAGIIGVTTSGTGNIPVQTLINTTNAPITVTYRASATSPASTACAGIEYSYNVTVNPKPVIGQPFNPSICSGDIFTVSPQQGGGNLIPAGTQYIWSAPVTSPAGSLTGGSAQNTPQAVISQMLVNSTSAIATATYSVTPLVNGCSGAPFVVLVTVFPLPKATISGEATVCQNSGSPFVTFTGADGMAPYMFTYRINNGSLQTITTTSGNSVSVSAPTGTTGSFTYTLASVQEGSAFACSKAQTGSVTITVDPLPTATISGDAILCRDAAAPFVTFSGSNGKKPYTFTYNINGGADQTIATTTGNSVTLSAPTNNPGDYIYNLVNVQDASANACLQAVTGSATVRVSSPPAPMTLVDQEFCVGVNTSEIVFTNTVGGTTYSWTSSNPAIGLATSGVGNIPVFMTRNPTANSITSTITVTPTANGCQGTSQTFQLTVRPPVIIFTPGDQTICSGESTALVTLGSSTAGAVFSWSATAPAGITGMASSGTNIIPVQTLINTTNAPIAVTYKAMATSPGIVDCEWVEYSYTVMVHPKPDVQETFNQDICSGSYFTVSPQNGALNSIPAGTQYTWSAPVISPAGSLSGGSSQLIPQAVISQTLVNNTSATATATYSVTPVNNGCPGAPFVISIRVIPLPKAAISGEATVCQNSAFPLITFTGTDGIAPYTFTYRINGGPLQTLTTSLGNSATVSAPTGSAGTFIYTLVSVQEGSALACSNAQAGTATIIVDPMPTATISGDASVCKDAAPPFITFTGSVGTPPYIFTYNINGGPTQTISTTSGSSVTLNVPTNVLGTYVYNLMNVQDASANACQQAVTGAAAVTISQPPAPMTLMDQELCNGEITSVINFTNTVAGTTYQWSSSNPSIGLAASGAGSLPSFTATNTTANPLTSTVTVTPSSNGCSGNSQTFLLTVHPSTVIFIPGDQTICSGENTSQVTLSSNLAGAQFSWTALQPSGIIGVTTSGTGNIPVQTLINTTGAPIDVIYRARANTPVMANCAWVEYSYTITVNPKPDVREVLNQSICTGSSFAVSPEDNADNKIPAGTSYIWSAPVISPAGSLTGGSAQNTPQALISQTLVNSTSVIATATYTVTPVANGCQGESFVVTVTVNPLPSAIISGGGAVCQHAAMPVITFSASNGIRPYTFIYNINGGAAQSITTDASSNSATLAVPTDVAGVYNYNLTGVKDATLGSCSRTMAASAVVTVNESPAPMMLADHEYCNGETTGAIIFTNPVAATTYQWSNSNPSIGLAATGTGPIPVFTAINTSGISIISTIAVIPSLNGCNGPIQTFSITVHPSPEVTFSPASQTICSGGNTSPVTLGSIASGAQFSWTAIQPAGITGVTTSGTSTIPVQTLINTTGAPIDVIYRASATSPGSVTCAGVEYSYTITVNPGGQVNRPGNQNICSGKDLSVNFTTQNSGGTTTYEWTNSNTSIGLGASGNGNISFVPVNTGNTVLTATLTVTPTYLNNGVSCRGNSETFTVSVYPQARVIKQSDQVVCNGFKTTEINFGGNVLNAAYNWTLDNASIGLPVSGSGNIAAFTAVNNGSVPVVATITVTPVANGCSGSPESFTIRVNPTPVVTKQPEGSTICIGEKPALLGVSAINGIGTPSYQWYSNTSNSTSGAALISNATNATYDPPATVAGTVYYYCVITFPTADCNELISAIARVTVNANPVISAIDQEINSGEVFTVIPTWQNGNIVPPGVTYTWSDPVISPANSVSGASAQSVPQAEISQQLTNKTMGIATVTYTVLPTSGSCTGAGFKVTVNVSPSLKPNVSVKPTACFGLNNGSITTDIHGGVPFGSGAPYTIVWIGPNGFRSTSANISNLSPGVYLLKITDATGMEFSASYTLNGPEEIMVVTDTQKDVTCYGAANGEIAITASGGTGAYRITWTKDNAAFANSEDIAGLEPGTYVVTVTDANNCTPKILTYTITQPDPLTISLEAKTDVMCFGASAGAIAVSVTGGVQVETAPGVFDYHYSWTGPGGFTGATKNLSNIPAGNYQLTVTDNLGCEASFSVALNEPSAITVTSSTTPISCYGANDATIELAISGGTPPYQADWDNYAQGTFQDNLSAGNYTITITDATLCQVTTTVNIPEVPVFKVSPVVKNVSCYGAKNGSIALNFESELKSVIFSWSDNSRSGTTRNNMGPGTYTVNIRGGDLCLINRTFVITEPLSLALSATVTDIMDCSSDNSGAIDVLAEGGTPPYRYAWTNGATSEDVANLGAGNYGVTVIDAMGCSRVAQYVVKRPLPLEIKVHPTIDFDCNSKEFIANCKASVTGGVLPYRLKWSAGSVENDHDQTMETNQSGIVIVTVTDSLGCTATTSYNLQIPHPGIESQQVDCDSHAFQFNEGTANTSDNTYSWDFGDGTSSNLKNPQHTYQTAGIYKVRLRVVNANLCTSIYDETVNAQIPPVVAIDKDPKFCPGDSVLLYGTGADNYMWNNGTTGDSIWIKYPGDYSVIGYTDAGCLATYNFMASYYDLVNYSIQTDYNEVTGDQNRIHFWSEDIPYSNYQWDFGDSLQGQGADLFHTYEISNDGYYDIKLKVINPNGCTEESTKRIWKSFKATINTFTPNGDGINDVYLRGWQIEVFNRNGILMYKGDEGWDGNYHGKPVYNDTYFVIIYDSTELGARYKTGYITVLR